MHRMRLYQASGCDECGSDPGPRRTDEAAAAHDAAGHRCATSSDPAVMQPAALLKMAKQAAGVCFRRRGSGGLDTFDDYVQDAALGGWKALETYDPERGASLPTYLWTRMVGSILDGQRARGHLSRTDMSRVKAAYEASEGGEVRLLPRQHTPVSLDALRTDPDSGRVSSWDIADPTSASGFERFERADLVAWLVEQVTGREREAIERTLLGSETLMAVGRDWGVTESRVCQIRSKGLARLYQSLQEPDLLSA